jgi:hypothetical protein
MSLPLPRRLFSAVLVALLIFGAVSSFGGAVLAIVFNGAGFPLEHLAGTWFPSFLVPGLILGIIVGGTQLVAALALLKGRHWALLAAATAGFAMLIWIFTELAIIGYSWLQSVYFGLGALELLLVLALLGIAPAIVSPVIAGHAALKGATSSGSHEAGHRVNPQMSRALRDGAS